MRARTADRRSTLMASAAARAALAALLAAAVLADPVPTSDAPLQSPASPVSSAVAQR